jgi:hypothetical protein
MRSARLPLREVTRSKRARFQSDVGSTESGIAEVPKTMSCVVFVDGGIVVEGFIQNTETVQLKDDVSVKADVNV